MTKLLLKIVLSVIIVGLMACKENKVTSLPDQNMTLYGEAFELKDVMNYDDFYHILQEKDSLNAVVSGTVESVCQAKGCWVNIISDTNPEMEPMFVKFKDYGFFLPKDIAGQTIVLNGKAYRELTTVDELRHYAEDEGLPQEEIDAIVDPKEELKFMASGVIIKNGQ